MAARGEKRLAALAPLRKVALAVGFGCALGASVMIFVTDNPQYLRIGILVALWGFVFAALAAARKQVEDAETVTSELELRRSYESELEREVTARREYELRLESQLRREVQDAFTSQVGGLRDELMRVRQELSEQWDSELRVERMVMRTQSVRLGSDRRESLERTPATIDAGPLDDELPDDAARDNAVPDDVAPEDAGPDRAAPAAVARDNAPPDQARAEESSSGTATGGRTDSDDPATVEVPVVGGAAPAVPTVATTPVPPLATSRVPDPTPWRRTTPPPAAMPEPAVTPASDRDADSPGDADDPDSRDVLARVLAEAGADTGRSRRKHRYAGEDEDAVPARF